MASYPFAMHMSLNRQICSIQYLSHSYQAIRNSRPTLFGWFICFSETSKLQRNARLRIAVYTLKKPELKVTAI
jgi:hypothetical protein